MAGKEQPLQTRLTNLELPLHPLLVLLSVLLFDLLIVLDCIHEFGFEEGGLRKSSHQHRLAPPYRAADLLFPSLAIPSTSRLPLQCLNAPFQCRA